MPILAEHHLHLLIALCTPITVNGFFFHFFYTYLSNANHIDLEDIGFGIFMSVFFLSVSCLIVKYGIEEWCKRRKEIRFATRVKTPLPVETLEEICMFLSFKKCASIQLTSRALSRATRKKHDLYIDKAEARLLRVLDERRGRRIKCGARS